MDILREVVESFVRLAKSEIHPGAVLVASDDVFEVTDVPSVVLQGPALSEDGARRTPAMLTRRNEADLTFEQCRYPRLYHLDFDIIVTTGKESELLDLTERVARFYLLHPVLNVGARGPLNLTELAPLGGLKRVNLSNLRQASGRCRIEDCPIYDGRIEHGKLTQQIRIETNLEGSH
ncbi:MAG: hypothetical protein M1335_08300 [Chloroflexi bacterium]|nr:hypothetical protein [Chloroflexota bacterium]